MQNIDFEKTRKSNIAFGGMQGFYYGANCMFFGFLISYLSSKGYSYTLIGVATTIIAASTMIVQPIFGYIIDSFITPKKILRITIMASMPFSILFFIFIENKAITLFIIALISIFYVPVGGILDSWSVRLREKGIGINYPITRSMGSVVYSLTGLIMGMVISKIGYLIIPYGYITLLIITLGFSFFADDVECKNKALKGELNEKRISFPKAFRMLISNYEYTVFLISFFFYSLGMRVIGTFITTIIEERGGTPTHLGIAFFIAAFFELPILLLFSSHIMRMKLPQIYIISLSLGLIRVLTINSFPIIGTVMLSQFFQGFSFGLSIPYLIEYINKTVPQNLKATAITIALSVGSGASCIIGNSLGGIIINNYGTKVLLNCATICLITALIVFVTPLIIGKKRNQEEES